MNEDLALFKKLETHRLEHRQLDEKAKDPGLDEFSRKKLQKIKLAVRDEIRKLEVLLYPNLTA